MQLEHRPEEMAEGHGRGAQSRELRQNHREKPPGAGAVVTHMPRQGGQLWPFLRLAVGAGVLVTIGEARKLVTGLSEVKERKQEVVKKKKKKFELNPVVLCKEAR